MEWADTKLHLRRIEAARLPPGLKLRAEPAARKRALRRRKIDADTELAHGNGQLEANGAPIRMELRTL